MSESVEEQEPNLLANLRTGSWLDEQTFPPLTYHVPGIFPEGSVLLVGPPKAGKSWLVLAVGLAIASGGRALGCLPVQERPVFYLALEDGDRRLQDRCRTLLCGAPIPPLFQYMTRIEPGTIVATIEAWLAIYGNDSPLVILDTLGKVMPPALAGESSYQRDYRVGSALKRVVDHRPGSTLLTNHHDRKAASDDFVDSVSGTHGLAGAADTVVVLCRDRHSTDGLLKVTGRDVAEGEYAIRFVDGSSWILDGANLNQAAARAVQRRATDSLDERSRSILDFVNLHPHGVRASDVATALDIDTAQARVYLSRLNETDRISRPTRGLYTPVASVSVLRPDVTQITDETWGLEDEATHGKDQDQ
jgi:RecA-family ATPase